MRTANGIQSLLARFEAPIPSAHIGGEVLVTYSQMICIVKTELTACLLELLGCQAFQRSLCRHRHEHGELNRSMGKMKGGCPGSRGLPKILGLLQVGVWKSTAYSALRDQFECQGRGAWSPDHILIKRGHENEILTAVLVRSEILGSRRTFAGAVLVDLGRIKATAQNALSQDDTIRVRT